MAVYADASHTLLDQTARWLLAAARALLGWAFIGISTVLPLSHPSDVHGDERAFLIAAFVLSVVAAFGLLFWAADAVRARG